MKNLVIVSGLLWLLSQGTLAQQPPDRPAGPERTPSQSKPASARLSSADILRTFRTIQIQTGTWLAKPEMCEGALQNHPQFDDWELSLVRGSGGVIVKIDHQPG